MCILQKRKYIWRGVCTMCTALVGRHSMPRLQCSNGVALEAPIIALRLLKHLPERALPLAGLLVLLLDPQRHLHHAPRDVPIAPQRLHGLVIITGAGGLVEERSPCILVLANQLDLLQGVLRLPLLHLLANLANRRLCCHWHREHAKSSKNFHLPM